MVWTETPENSCSKQEIEKTTGYKFTSILLCTWLNKLSNFIVHSPALTLWIRLLGCCILCLHVSARLLLLLLLLLLIGGDAGMKVMSEVDWRHRQQLRHHCCRSLVVRRRRSPPLTVQIGGRVVVMVTWHASRCQRRGREGGNWRRWTSWERLSVGDGCRTGHCGPRYVVVHCSGSPRCAAHRRPR